MSLADQRERGQKAEKLLTDPLFAECFGEVRNILIEAWEQAPIRDKEGAHELKLMMKLLGDVRAILERAITDGKIAAAELTNQERRDLSPAQFRANHLRR